MKKTLTVLACLLLSFCFILGGCAKLELPPVDAVVYGNGGTVVQKGDYVYFANAYTGYSSIGSNISNKTGKADVYSLYRTKVSNSDKSLNVDKDGFVTNAELVVSKVVGFEYSNLYIVGDYLYFSSPNMHKTSNNENRFELISIFKVKLDGTGLKELYTTNDYTNGDWQIVNFDDTNYLITVEGSQIVRHTVDKKGDLTNKTVLATNVSKAILSNTTTFTNDRKIFFTANRETEETSIGLTGNILKSVDIVSGSVKTLKNVIGETINILSYGNGYLVYTRQTPTEEALAWVSDFAGNESRLTMWTGLSNVYVTSIMNQGLKAIYTYESKIVIQSFNSLQTQVLIDGNATIINVVDEYVYYTLDNKISRISLITQQTQNLYEDANMGTVFDFDGRFIYLFTQTANNSTGIKYMHRIDTFGLEQDFEIKAQPMGIIKDTDKKEDEE